MIKTTVMFSAHTIHLLHVILRDTLIFLIILFAALFVWLKSGINVDHLSFNKYKVDGLYIKLDKKLTLKANNIVIPKMKKKPSFDNIDQVLDRVKYLLTFFHYIELEQVNFKDNHYKMVYADNILYITSDDYEIAGNVWRRGRVLIADISLFYIKKENINMVAKFNYDLHTDKLILEGSYDAYHIKGKFKAIKEEHNVEFVVNSDTFSDLKTFIDKIPMKKKLNAWITEKIKAREYRLYSLRGKGTVYGSEFKPDLDSLKGNALLEDVNIHYKEGLSPVKAENILLRYESGELFFNVKKPTYQNREINASSVTISNIGKGKIARLDLDMHFNTKVDEVVQEILKAYKLNIPVLHKESRSKVEVKLGIPLKKMPKRKIDVYVQASLGKGNLYIQKLKLPVVNGNILYEKGLLKLKDIKLKEKWYEGTVNGKVKVREKTADLVFQVKKIELKKKKETLFFMTDKKIPFYLNYTKGVRITIPSLKTKVIREGKKVKIEIEDIAKIKPYLKKMEVDVDGGTMTVNTNDFNTYTFAGQLYRKDCFIYDNKVCYTMVPCFGTSGPKGIDFYAFNKRLHFNSAKSLIELNALNIDLHKFLSSDIRIQKIKTKKAKASKTVIKGRKSNIRYDKYTLLTDKYNVSIFSPSGTIKATGNLGKDVVTFNKRGKQISIEALRIHDRMLHPLINFDGLQNGRYTIKISGDPNKLMKGEILLEGGVLKSFKAYNKARNFIRNNKDLAQFQDPGFTAKGFKIREGKITYRVVKNRVIFDSVYIRGNTATIVGKGELDINTKKLNINLAIQTVRKIGKIVGSLPVLGYILMGEDNSITFGLKITGTLDDPKVKTSAAKEILMLPFDLIKRTLQSPAHIINTEKRKKKNPVIEEITVPKDRVAP